MNAELILQNIEHVCPKTIESMCDISSIEAQRRMLGELGDKRAYAFGYETIDSDKQISRGNDILVGFIAKTDCSFLTTFGGYSFGQRDMKAGEFQFALLDKSIPLLSTLYSDLLVTNVTGSFYAVFANLENYRRRIISIQTTYVYSDRVRIEHGQLQKF